MPKKAAKSKVKSKRSARRAAGLPQAAPFQGSGESHLRELLENAHRIHNPITPEKLATLGSALRLEPGARLLDLGSGSGEMLCTWARDQTRLDRPCL